MTEGKKKRGRPKKSETVLEKELDVLDRPIKSMKFNHDMVVEFACKQVDSMIDDRREWHDKRSKYLPEFENLVRDNKKTADAIWRGSADFHVPLTLMLLKQMHARLVQAMVGDEFGFVTEPGEGMDVRKVRVVDRVMRWAVRNYVNKRKGLYLTVDDWMFDVCKEGWGILKRDWDVEKKKVVLTEEDLALFNEGREPEEIIESAAQIIETFDGPMVRTVEHEMMLFPGMMQDSSDLDEPRMIAELVLLTEQEVNERVRRGLWDEKAAKEVLANSAQGGTGNTEVDDAMRLKHAAQGTRAPIDSSEQAKGLFPVYECHARYDVDEDGFDEDVVFWYSKKADVIPRWTTIDRVSPKTLKRPYYKADFIRRPRRGYSVGMAELLYSVNREMDALRNQRVDFATLANVPFFFYKPAAGVKKNQKMRIGPGVGIPLNNPSSDVNFPRFNTQITFTRQDEQQLVSMAERIVALPPATAGQVSSPAGATMHATGFVGLLNQVGIDFDTILMRSKVPYQQYLKHMHNDLEVKMPNGIKFRLLGADGSHMVDDKGMVIEEVTDRLAIQGEFDFVIHATSKTLNREIVKQDALLTMQTLMNPMLTQTGLVGPEQLHEATADFLRSRGHLNVDRLLRNPEQVEAPLTLANEITILTQGEMPRIVMNDNHEAKVAGLTEFMNSEMFGAALQSGVLSATVPGLFESAIKKHQGMLDSITAQAGTSNVTGLQISPSLGARLSGELNQQTGRSLAEEEVLRSQDQTQNLFNPENLEG